MGNICLLFQSTTFLLVCVSTSQLEKIIKQKIFEMPQSIKNYFEVCYFIVTLCNRDKSCFSILKRKTRRQHVKTKTASMTSYYAHSNVKTYQISYKLIYHISFITFFSSDFYPNYQLLDTHTSIVWQLEFHSLDFPTVRRNSQINSVLNSTIHLNAR